MSSVMKMLVAMGKKQWQTASADTTPIPITETPLAGLHQRSVVKIDSIPLTLAIGAGSLFKDMPDQHHVPMVGT
jgi:hypothetical protein